MEVSKEQMSIMQYIASGNPGAVTVIGEFMYYDNRELILSELKKKEYNWVRSVGDIQKMQ